jgi:hypothetical protein
MAAVVRCIHYKKITGATGFSPLIIHKLYLVHCSLPLTIFVAPHQYYLYNGHF